MRAQGRGEQRLGCREVLKVASLVPRIERVLLTIALLDAMTINSQKAFDLRCRAEVWTRVLPLGSHSMALISHTPVYQTIASVRGNGDTTNMYSLAPICELTLVRFQTRQRLW